MDTQWDWVKETPSGLGLFFNDSDLLAFVVKRLAQVPEIDVVDAFIRSNENLHSGDTVLHALAKGQVNETKMEAIMICLQNGFEPGLKNKAGKSFLEATEFRDGLLEEILVAPDSWALSLFKSWTTGGE